MQVVLCSGGIDSLVCAEMARETGELAGCVFVDYGHPAQQAEGWKVFAYCGSRGIPLKVVHAFGLDLGGMAKAVWADGDHGVKRLACCRVTGREFEVNGHRKDCAGNARVVPARNAILLSLAANAAKQLGGTSLVYGANSADHDDYTDCRVPFMAAMRTALELSVWSPLITKSKAEIVELARGYGLTREESWSCYGGGPVACGHCASCRESDAAWGTP